MARKRQRTIKIDVLGMPSLKKIFLKLREFAPEVAREVLADSAERVEMLARTNILTMSPYPAFDTGALFDSIEARVWGLQSTVGSSVAWAPYIEFGTKPHFPPLDPIREWCIRKGIPPSAAYPIAKKISERGTPKRPFLYPAFEAERKEFYKRMRDAARAALVKKVAR